jgi:hypothetical protein
MTTPRRGGRAVECTGLENRSPFHADRGFESRPLRSAPPRFGSTRRFARSRVVRVRLVPRSMRDSPRQPAPGRSFPGLSPEAVVAPCVGRPWLALLPSSSAVPARFGQVPPGRAEPKASRGARYLTGSRGGARQSVPTSWVRCICMARGSPRRGRPRALEWRSRVGRRRRSAGRPGLVCLWCARGGLGPALPAQPGHTQLISGGGLALSRPARQGRA